MDFKISLRSAITYEERDKYAKLSGKMVMELLAKKIKPRDIVTKKALENAATIVAATGGSTNAALHLPAIANEAGIKFDLMDVAKIFKNTPYLQPFYLFGVKRVTRNLSRRKIYLILTILTSPIFRDSCIIE